MKKIFLITLIFLGFAVFVYAQQADRPTSAETRQEAQQFLTEARSNSTAFDSTLADFRTRSTSNEDAATFNRLRNEIQSLENLISQQERRISAALRGGSKVSNHDLQQLERMIQNHKSVQAELEAFIARSR